MDKKITVRLSLFFVIISLIPAVVCWLSAYYSLKRSQIPLTKDFGTQIRVCGARSCQFFTKSLINSNEALQKGFQWQYEGGENNLYKNYLDSAKASLTQEKNSAIFFTVLAILATVPIAIAFFLNRVVIEKGNIKIYQFGSLKNLIPVDKISKIDFETSTPFSSFKTKVNQVDWRDVVYLTYDAAGGEKTIFVKLDIYPDFKKVVREIAEKNKSLNITFSKKTAWQSFKAAL